MAYGVFRFSYIWTIRTGDDDDNNNNNNHDNKNDGPPWHMSGGVLDLDNRIR